MTIIEYESETVKKKSGAHASEKRLYVSSLPTSTPALGSLVRKHWSIESMHWTLDFNLLQDRIKRKSAKAARNLDSIQRIVHSVFSIWKRLRKKRSDKKKGMAEYEICIYEFYQTIAFPTPKIMNFRFLKEE